MKEAPHGARGTGTAEGPFWQQCPNVQLAVLPLCTRLVKFWLTAMDGPEPVDGTSADQRPLPYCELEPATPLNDVVAGGSTVSVR